MSYVKFFSLLIFLVFVLSLTSQKHTAEAFIKTNVHSTPVVSPTFSQGNDLVYRLRLTHKEGVSRRSRKVLEDLVQLDYDDAGPNPKHDPKKGKGGKN